MDNNNSNNIKGTFQPCSLEMAFRKGSALPDNRKPSLLAQQSLILIQQLPAPEFYDELTSLHHPLFTDRRMAPSATGPATQAPEITFTPPKLYPAKEARFEKYIEPQHDGYRQAKSRGPERAAIVIDNGTYS